MDQTSSTKHATQPNVMSNESFERPMGVYLVTLYFVVAGFLESIKDFRELEGPILWNPFALDSVWLLLVNIIIYLTIAYLVWHFASLGRIAALVYGYLMILTHLGALAAPALWSGDEPLNVTSLRVVVSIFHVVALIPVVIYLQPASRKQLFQVSLWELIISD